MINDYLLYLTDEGFVSIYYWYKSDSGLIDGRVSAIKQYEPIYLEMEEGGTKLLWRTEEQVYTYDTTSAFFKKYGKLCKDESVAIKKSNEWMASIKELYALYG